MLKLRKYYVSVKIVFSTAFEVICGETAEAESKRASRTPAGSEHTATYAEEADGIDI